MTVEPRLANRCEPSDDATVWTCRLRGGVRYADGARFDAGDVLASFVAQWDRSQPLRKGSRRAVRRLGRPVRRHHRRRVAAVVPAGPVAPASPRPGPAYLTSRRCIRIACSSAGPSSRRVSRYLSSPADSCWLPAVTPAASPAVIASRSCLAPASITGNEAS